MIRLASSEVHATNGKRSGPTSKPRWLRTALTGAGLGTEKRALTLGILLRWFFLSHSTTLPCLHYLYYIPYLYYIT